MVIISGTVLGNGLFKYEDTATALPLARFWSVS